MPALYPLQDTFVRGEITSRLHARASLDLYRAALSKCENFITLPHGGIRKRGGTYYAGEVKNSAKKARVIPFIFSVEQAYCLEFGDQYLRVYAYGARVGTVEVATPWLEVDLWDIQFYQSADVMWIVHSSYAPRRLTRTDNTTWTIDTFEVEDGPYLEINISGTTLTPADYGSAIPKMTSNTAPSGTAADSLSSTSSYLVFDKDTTTRFLTSGATQSGNISYDFAGSATKVVDAYYVTADTTFPNGAPTQFRFEGYDGTNWITLDTRTGETGWVGGETRFYEFNNDTAFQGYRLRWSAINDSNVIAESCIAEIGVHEKATNQTAFNLTASAATGINDGQGFLSTDVGRHVRVLGSDGEWRWAKITSRTSSTVVKVQIYGHALPDLSPVINWRLGAWSDETGWPDSVTLFEERLMVGKKFRINGSRTGDFETFTPGEKDDDAVEFLQAGGGQANDIVWIADADGALVIATAGGIRALSGSGLDEALTPSSFKNRKSRTHGAARIRPVNAGRSFLYVTRSRRSIAELTTDNVGRFTSEDVGQISDHIPKKGVVEIDYQSDPDPLLWFPLDTGELGCYTHQPSEEVRGMHRHILGGAFTGSSNAIVESVTVTPGQGAAPDDVWLLVKRTINGSTKRYIEVMQAPFEYKTISEAVQVDCALAYSGSATGTLTGLAHLNGQTVDVLASDKVYRGLTVSGGSITLPGGATTTKAVVGLPFTASADSLELDVGGRDGSLVGRRKKVAAVILSLLETDTSGLSIRSKIRGNWETAKVPTNVTPDGTVSLFTGNVKVLIDDSFEGQGRIEIRHTNPTPCTIRALTPIFDAEP